MGHRISSDWWSALDFSLVLDQTLPNYNKIINYPVIAIFVQIAYYTMFFYLISVMLTLFYIVTDKKYLFSIISLCIYLFLGVSYKIPFETFYMLNLSNYAFFYQAMLFFHNITELLIYIIALFCMLIILVKIHMRDININIKEYYPLFLYCLIVLIGLIFYPDQPQVNQGLEGYIQFLTYGVSNDGYTLLSISFYYIVFFGILYLRLLSWDKKLSTQFYYHLIRYRKPKLWLVRFLLNNIMWIFFFMVVFSLLVLLVYMGVFGGDLRISLMVFCN